MEQGGSVRAPYPRGAHPRTTPSRGFTIACRAALCSRLLVLWGPMPALCCHSTPAAAAAGPADPPDTVPAAVAAVPADSPDTAPDAAAVAPPDSSDTAPVGAAAVPPDSPDTAPDAAVAVPGDCPGTAPASAVPSIAIVRAVVASGSPEEVVPLPLSPGTGSARSLEAVGPGGCGSSGTYLIVGAYGGRVVLGAGVGPMHTHTGLTLTGSCMALLRIQHHAPGSPWVRGERPPCKGDSQASQ